MDSKEDRDRVGRAAEIMRPPDRNLGRNVTSSKRHLRCLPLVPPPPPLRGSPAMVMMPTPGHVGSGDSEREMSRKIAGSLRHVHEEGSEDEEEGDFWVIANPASQLPLTQRVTRDTLGRYATTRETSSSTDRFRPLKRDSSWILRGPVVGGPANWSVLQSFGGHVAFTSCSEPNEAILRSWIKCYERPGVLREIRQIQLSDVVAARVDESGLGVLRGCFTTGLDDNLLSAFIERWRSDTNTFHMPFGEISIMLHEVERILGIPVSGDRVFVDGMVEVEEGSAREDVALKVKVTNLFGVPEVSGRIFKGGRLLAFALREVVEEGNDHDSFRAYILLLLGHTLFMDKSGDRVSGQLLPLLDDLDRVGRYVWGAGCLAYLYWQLGMASR